MKRFSVTRNTSELVSPSEPTPSVCLPLSAIDNTPHLDRHFKMLKVYRHGQDPAKVIKEAISKTLVPYYPVAGNVRRSECGELEIDRSTSNGGVCFVEGSADCTLEDVNYFFDQPPLLIPMEQLVPSTTDQELRKPVLSLQVTQFKCGGFTVGIEYHHSVFDGFGLAQFMNAVAEISRGHPKPTVEPIWFREAIPNHQKVIIPKSAYIAALTSSTNNLKQHIIDISSDQINKLKNNFTKETNENCSTFDVLVALLWRLRTRAINREPHVNVTLTFPIDMRPNLNQVLPSGSGYYGNLLYVSVVKNTSEFVGQAAFAEVVKIVRDAKRRSFKKCSTWSSQGFDEELTASDDLYLALTVSDWRHLGLHDIDYGWGAPTNIIPDQTNINMPTGLCELLRSPVFEGGVRLWTHGISQEHFEMFLDQVKLAL